ncbi:MAG: Rid family detoxifying hydrolase [Bdellovibrionota bacterium]
MEFIKNVTGAPKPVGAYSPAVKANGFVFLAGQVGLDPESGALVEGGLEAQAKQVMKNLSAVLSASGSSPSEIVMTSIFLANIADAKAVNAIYGDWVNADAAPARQTFAVKDLPLGALVEISVIAVAK